LSDAVTLAVPAATPVTLKVAVDEPVGTVMGDCTVATAGLLLLNVTLAAADAALASVTVPCAEPPTPIVVGLTTTLDTPGPDVVVGDVDDVDPHRVTHSAANSNPVSATVGDLGILIIGCGRARTGP
jgi:hypothetical protein